MPTSLQLQPPLSFPSTSTSTSTSTSLTKPSHSLPYKAPNILPTKPPPHQQQSTVLQSHPLYGPAQPHLSHHLQEKILCLELLGVDAGKALSLNPSLRLAPLPAINSVLSFLRSKAGLRHSDLPKVLGMCPSILTSDIASDLSPVLRFLSHDLAVPDHRLRRALTKTPRLLACSARDQLRPALFYLQRLGFSDLDALAYRDSVLLVSSVENTLVPKLRFLQSLGLSRDEAVAMVLRCPALFTFSIDNNFKPKFDFFAGQMGRKVEELKNFPQYFAFSLEKRIKPRHAELARRGLERDIALPLMLKSTDEEFWDLITHGTTGNGC